MKRELRGRVKAWPTLPCKFYFILYITFSGCNHYFAALPFHRPKRKKKKSKSNSMNLEWIFIMTPSRARKPFLKASPYIFLTTFVWTEYGYDGDRFNAARLFHVLSEESAKKKRVSWKTSTFTRWISWIFLRRRPLMHLPEPPRGDGASVSVQFFFFAALLSSQ